MNEITWELMGRDDAQQMASETGHAVIWVRDVRHGYARLLLDGETHDQAVAEFESIGGEVAETAAIYEPLSAS